jgi:hypothetical protein
MSKCALLIGINYTDVSGISLRGCIDDIVGMKTMLVSQYGFDPANILMLRDDMADHMPTRDNMMKAIYRLMSISSQCSEIWIHYSGHGSQIQDPSSKDAYDSVIVPVDYQTKGLIVDNELCTALQYSKCPTMVLMDCCHSGNVCELQYTTEYLDNNKFSTLKNKRPLMNNPNIVVFSGCKENQTAADMFDYDDRDYEGAFTDAFLDALKLYQYNVSIKPLYQRVCRALVEGGFAQKPMISSSSADLTWKFAPKVKAIVKPRVPTRVVVQPRFKMF